MAKNRKKEYRRPAGVKDIFGLTYMNIAAAPEKEETRAVAGQEVMMSTDLKEGVVIKAINTTTRTQDNAR